MEVATLLTPSAIIGVWKTKDDNFLLRLRHGYAGLKLSYLFSQIIAQGMRQQGCPETFSSTGAEARKPVRVRSKAKAKVTKERGKFSRRESSQAKEA